jgi:hypothetical protein
MKNLQFLPLIAALSLHAADGVDTWFKEGRVYGNIKYYYIDTSKETPHSSAHANSIGGQLGYVSGSLYGLTLGATFMTTNPFAIPQSPANVDTSIIGRDNAARTGVAADGDDGFSVLGEAYVRYSRDNYDVWYGRKIMQTPLMDAKEVRMLPSSVEGGMVSVLPNDRIRVSAGFVDKFKQRSSDRFIDVIEHVLGANTRAVTGHGGGYVLPVSAVYQNGAVSFRAYDYYAPDFMNSFYADATFGNSLNGGFSYSASVQGIVQDALGNAKSAEAAALMGGVIHAREIGAKASVSYDGSELSAACTHVFASSGYHDSLVLPWDGTPLYTNMITSNDLFVSNYGKGLTSDSAYIGGTTGIKLGVVQKFEIAGVKGFSAGVSYAHYGNGRFKSDQDDINGELGYGAGDFSLALKGMWVHDSTSSDAVGNISQNERLTQYRVIANYKF